MRFRPLLLALAAAFACAAPAQAATNDPLRAQQYGLDLIEADAAHGVTTGSGAVVAVIDSGVLATHQDLQGRLLAGRDFVSDDATPQDGNGHGTHVTGIVAATANNGVGVAGAAPGAQVLPVRVLDDDGAGSTEDVAEGIDYAVAQGADVINLSLGGLPISAAPIDGSDVFVAAINRATAAGVVVVAAAGNDSLPICEQPEVQGEILCVGSIDKRGMRSFFSSSGNISAPGGSGLGEGEDILSAYNDGGYTEIAGTSQAAPHVAAVAALLVSRGVRGKPAVDRILATARDAGPAGPDSLYGAGIVNARAAVEGLPASPGGGGSAAGGVSVKRRQRIRTVLRRGVRMRCRASAAGRCRARITARGRVVARGSKRVAAGQTVPLRARVTRAGRRLLRRVRRQRARLTVQVPGRGPVKRRLVFLR